MTIFNGFTLIELMVVLAIMSLFSVFAYPAYLRYGLAVKRLEGQNALFDIAIQLEQYQIEHQGCEIPPSLASLGIAEKTEKGWYQLSLKVTDSRCYTIVGTPTFKDKACTQLSYNAQGERLSEGSGSMLECWGV